MSWKRLAGALSLAALAVPATVLGNDSSATIAQSTGSASCAVANFTHGGYAPNTLADEIVYDGNAVAYDQNRDLGTSVGENGWTVTHTYPVPLTLTPGVHTLRAKVEVNGNVKFLSEPVTVNCPAPAPEQPVAPVTLIPVTPVTPAKPVRVLFRDRTHKVHFGCPVPSVRRTVSNPIKAWNGHRFLFYGYKRSGTITRTKVSRDGGKHWRNAGVSSINVSRGKSCAPVIPAAPVRGFG